MKQGTLNNSSNFSARQEMLVYLIVDDNSPDGTGDIVKKLEKQHGLPILNTQNRKNGSRVCIQRRVSLGNQERVPST